MDNAMDRALQHRIKESTVLQQAAEWFVELQSETVPIERIVEWQHWLAEDERHHAAYQELESTWSAIERLETPSWPRAEEVAADRYQPSLSVSGWRTRRAKFHLRLAWTATAALVLVLVASQLNIVRNWLAPSTMVVETRTGERQEIRLSDGSIITVGGRSPIAAALTPQERAIRLIDVASHQQPQYSACPPASGRHGGGKLA